MEGKPTGPGDPLESSSAEAAPDASPATPVTYGVVEVERLKKDDGRALIVFTVPGGR